MDWVLSAVSMLVLWLMGNKNKYGPIIGVIGQILWIYYALSIKQYGLLAGTIGYLVIHCRNSYKWLKSKEN